MRISPLLALGLLPLLGCVSPRMGSQSELHRELRLYELSGARLLHCELGARESRNGRGMLQCTSPDGERFQGEWMKMKETTKSSSSSDTEDMSSLPILGTRTSLSNWDWATGLGVDLEKSGQKCIFLLYGDRGTVIDGIVVGDASGKDGVMGAARDNKGRRYRVMG